MTAPHPGQAPVTILASGVHLGVYVPSLLVRTGLTARGVAAEVLVLEDFYKPGHRDRLPSLKRLFHADFSAALMAHRMVGDIRPALDPDRVSRLLDSWQSENRRCFVMWSGFWMPILEEYRRRFAPGIVQIDLCRIDAEVSATFKAYADIDIEQPGYREIWLWRKADRRLVHGVQVAGPPLPWADRRRRAVVHGGGWGIGTYRDKIGELGRSGLGLDIIAYDPAEAEDHPTHRWFMVDPGWCAWGGEPGRAAEFPPFGPVTGRVAGPFVNRPDHHDLFDVVRQAEAIVSKPGGGTLIDSLAAATPLIMLEAYGYAEQANAEVWEHLGFGISYQSWKESGWDRALLERLHGNLRAAAPLAIDYAADCAERWQAQVAAA